MLRAEIKNHKWWLNPVWHRLLYSCIHMPTVGVEGLNHGCWYTVALLAIVHRICIHVCLWETEMWLYMTRLISCCYKTSWEKWRQWCWMARRWSRDVVMRRWWSWLTSCCSCTSRRVAPSQSQTLYRYVTLCSLLLVRGDFEHWTAAIGRWRPRDWTTWRLDALVYCGDYRPFLFSSPLTINIDVVCTRTPIDIIQYFLLHISIFYCIFIFYCISSMYSYLRVLCILSTRRYFNTQILYFIVHVW